MLIITAPKVEYMINPISVPLNRVRFSWMAETSGRGEFQTAYQILVIKASNEEIVWDSGKIISNQTTGIIYNGKPLHPRTQYFWKVKIWSNTGTSSNFCDYQCFETCLSNDEWEKSKWIGANVDGLPCFRKSFMVADKKITRARVYASGLGVYELTLNGKQIDDRVLNPLVTRYHKRYFYNAYDVTSLLNTGENVFGVLLGNGYYAMSSNGVDWQKEKWANAPWSDKPKFKLLAYVTYEDGSEMQFFTDESWKSATSPIRVDEAYYGEEYDARYEQKGWNEVGFDDGRWQTSKLTLSPSGQAEVQLVESCKIIKTSTLSLMYHTDNEFLFDAENMFAGWVRITVSGKRGDEVEISYSEWLDENGKLVQKNMLGEWDFAGRIRKAQTDYYVLRGDGEESYAPHFTYKGFRYVCIRTKGDVTLKNVVVESIHTDLIEIGDFSCSDKMINQIHAACKNTLLNNFHSYPSDTPVYENMGYLADGFLTQELALFNYDAIKFYEKWARDIKDQVKENGYIEQTAPMWDEDKENAPEWSAAIAIVPYQLYRVTGDATLLIENYEMAKKVFSYQMDLTDNCIATSMWGDHASSSNHTIKEISATVFLFYMANILAETGRLRGNEEEYMHYHMQAENIKYAFNNYFFNEYEGYYQEKDQRGFLIGAQVLPYAFGLANETQKARIKENLKKYVNNLDGGIFTIKYMFPVLTEIGQEELLYDWVTAKNAPSWGYWISSGDNSLWEQWYDFTRSRNHHMFGTVDEWLYKTLAGLEPLDYKTIRIKPFIAERLTWASAHTTISQGRTSCFWKKYMNKIVIEVEIPFNAEAKVHIPKKFGNEIYMDDVRVEEQKEIRIIENNSLELILRVGSGKYEFQIR